MSLILKTHIWGLPFPLLQLKVWDYFLALAVLFNVHLYASIKSWEWLQDLYLSVAMTSILLHEDILCKCGMP